MRSGRAVFVAPDVTLPRVRQAVRRARAAGAAPRAYRVIFEWAQYPGKLERALADLGAHLGSARWLLEGAEEEDLRCALLTDAGTGDGILLHFEAGRPLVSYYPPDLAD